MRSFKRDLESPRGFDENLRTTTRFKPGEDAMRIPIEKVLLGTVLFCALGVMGHAQAQAPASPPPPTRTLRAVSNFVPATDEVMRSPKPEDWLVHRGNYQAWGYSPLDK